jgi:hypothetical protein
VVGAFPKNRLFAEQSQFLLCKGSKNKANSKPNKAKQTHFKAKTKPFFAQKAAKRLQKSKVKNSNQS